MDIRFAEGCGGEQLQTFEEADAATVINLGSQKPFISPSVSSSSVSSTPERVGPMIDSLNGEQEEDEFEWVAVEREDRAPEIEEVEDAFSALQLMFNDDDDDDKDQVSDQSELVDWIEPPLQLCNTSLLQPYMLDRFYDAFHMFQTDTSVQRMVMSLASDRAVWDAVMNNEVVRELITNAERSEEEDSGLSVNFIRRLLQRSAIKIMDAMEGVTKYVTDLFYGDETIVPGDERVVLATGAAPAMEKLQMTVLLAIVVLLIVFVTRASRRR
ncbi:Transmembrane protein [Hirschfeldia incana]|nr:Transmembrane protein [Hirschfeldia incana]